MEDVGLGAGILGFRPGASPLSPFPGRKLILRRTRVGDKENADVRDPAEGSGLEDTEPGN